VIPWIEDAPRHLFFTGKGGVGKTSLATATAVALADRGRRVLLVSTDPASNLDAVLGASLGRTPSPVQGIEHLDALNIDPEAAAQAYRDRVVGPYRDLLPTDTVRGIEEQLSGACTVEVAAFDEFTMLLGEDGSSAGYDHVVFDTAPTGHTIRLLSLPAAWTDFLDTNERGSSCLGPASGLKMQRDRYAATVAALADPSRTLLLLVTRPEPGAVEEAARSSRDLAGVGFAHQHLLVNGVFEATDRSDPLALAMEEGGRTVLAQLPDPLRGMPRTLIALGGRNIVGIDAARSLLSGDAVLGAHAVPRDGAGDGSVPGQVGPEVPEGVLPLQELADELAASDHGLVMVMGKGGVGKTSVAAALAMEMVRRGVDVHLTTTDPAAHLEHAVGADAGRIRISRIDPAAESQGYRRKILERQGRTLDADGMALLEEDLRSPCTEEVAVFHAFSRIVAGARRELVIMDTAPTGHTLLLLDAAGSYHREVLRNTDGVGASVTTPLMRLRDPGYTRILIVTLAETTPVLEAAALADDLRRAGIEPYAWVVNASLAAAGPTDPLLRSRASEEVKEITTVVEELAARVYLVPRLLHEPVGADGLQRMLGESGLASIR